jgi:hypothetical protein
VTDKSAVTRMVRAAKAEMSCASPRNDDHPRLHIHIAPPRAKVFLLRGRYRDAAYVKRHVAHVLTRSAEQGEANVVRNLKCIRENLEEMGIDKDAIDAEVRSIEAAVRAEIWRQVLTPDGDR